ncbi:MAG: ATP-dependent Clp protease ATP-binding subunit, partial [Polyangiaceae bacterium]|nr:ATP-dependent Clp protease ATP-binding subunit [Polyangiaceae bacterium]
MSDEVVEDEAEGAEEAGEGGREARVLVLVRERFDGARLAFPAAEPRFASLGSEEDVIAEQELFLREHLARSRPDTIARLSLPAGTRLVEVGVPVPREDLPRRLQSNVPVTFVCVVIPAGGAAPRRGQEAWVMVPALGHTFYVERDEPLEDAIRHEVRRLLASQDLTAWDHVGLLPGRAHRLEALRIPLPPLEGAAARAPRRAEIAARAARRKAAQALAGATTPLHVGPRREPRHVKPLAYRDAELARLPALLDGQERLGVLLVGPEHAGKSALFSAYLARTRRLVYATSGAQLVAGMSGLGEWQERVRDVMEAARSLDAILYIEHLEDLLAERAEGGGLDLAGAMRPWIEDGKVRLVAEIREDRAGALEGRHWAFFAALGRIKVEPLTAAQTLSALERRAVHDARTEPHRPRVDAGALPALVDLAERFLPYGAVPGKAVRLYEDLRAAREKDMTEGGAPVTIGRADLYEVFSMRTGVPAFLLREDLPLRVDEVAGRLRGQIIGQEQAVLALAQTIGVVKAGLWPSGKPLATVLFVGPTGVGKTELARALAELLFGSAERMARFDMSEFMTPDAADRLIRGTDREGGLLTTRVREQPFCVLLLDEIEKAHRAVFDLLLQVTGEGRLTDARGKTAYFHNAILIMTSNLGSAERRAQAGFGGGGAAPDEAHYRRIVDGAFRPELVNRIDRIIPFRALDRAEVAEVARLAIDKVARRRGLTEAGIGLDVSARALLRIAADGYSEAYGARALRR